MREVEVAEFAGEEAKLLRERSAEADSIRAATRVVLLAGGALAALLAAVAGVLLTRALTRRPRVKTKMPKKKIPDRASLAAAICESRPTGSTSPYPTVVNVMTDR